MFKKLFAKRADPRVELVPGGEAFTVGRSQTVLESALKAGIAYPHDCTVGTCGSCRSRLVSGKVDAITPFGYTLSREELAAGYILACQAVPESDLVLEVELSEPDETPRAVSARLAATLDLTHDIKQVTWECAEPVSYRAGQYMKVTWPGAPGARSYSFSAAPTPGGQTRLASFIRKVPGGVFTEQLFAGELSDAPFVIDVPHGNFWLREGAGPILLIAGGSGLAPILSLLEEAANRGVGRDAILLFGGRAERDLYCGGEIAAIAARWRGRFEYRPVLSEEAVAGRRSGLVTAEIPAALAELGSTGDLQAYLCGPPAMIDAGVAVLTAEGVALSAIHYDKFTDASTANR